MSYVSGFSLEVKRRGLPTYYDREMNKYKWFFLFFGLSVCFGRFLTSGVCFLKVVWTAVTY